MPDTKESVGQYDPESLLADREDEPERPVGGGVPEYMDDPSVNLAMVFGRTADGRQVLQKVSSLVIDNFDEAWRAGTDRRNLATRAWKYFAGAVPRTWKPHKNSADVNVPIVTENGARLAMRAYQELFGDFRAVCDVIPNGDSEEDLRNAARLTKHTNWQLCNQFTEFPREMHAAVMMHFLQGDWVCVSSFDKERGRNLHEVLAPDDYVVPWVNRSTAPDYSDVPFFCRIRHLYPHQIEANKDEWYGVEVCKKGKPSWADDPQQEYTKAVQETQGMNPDGSDAQAPRKVLQYEGWLMIYGQTEQRYCKSIVDYDSGEVFWLSFLEEEDEDDRQRYESQLEELNTYRASVMDMSVNPDLPAPDLPSWVDQDEDPEMASPRPINRKPLHLRAHGVCIEPIKGPMGIGFGIILTAYNECANSTLDAFLDQVVASTVYSWLTTDRKLAEENGGQIVLEPGTVKLVTGVAPADLKDAMVRVEPPTPNPQAVQVVQMMRDYGQSAAHASDVMSGRPGKSGESAKGQNERLEQAMAMLSVSSAKFIPAFEQILKNNAKLNSIHLRDEEFYQVTRAIPMPMGVANVGLASIPRALYAAPYFASMRADARFVSRQQRVQEADQLLMMTQHPGFAGNVKMVRRALVKALEVRGHWDIAQMAVEGWATQDQAAAMAPPSPPGMPPGSTPGAPPGQAPQTMQRPGAPPAPPQGPPRPPAAPQQGPRPPQQQ